MPKLIVDVRSQTVALVGPDGPRFTARCSTAAAGLGCEAGSYKTPTGLFRIAEKIGGGAPPGTVFRARAPTGEVWEPGCGLGVGEDLILSRILWLEGLAPENANTKERFIYLHGTNDEAGLGSPLSHGCVRLANRDVIELFDLVEVGTLVEIRGDDVRASP